MANELIENKESELGGVSKEGLRMLERIAVFKSSGISDAALCDSFSFDLGTLHSIFADPVFKDIESRILADKIEANLEVDGDWDKLEARALQNLTKVASVNKDPELNLKIAAVANKAVRRTRAGNTILDASQSEGARTTIKLTQRMISKLGTRDSGSDEVLEREVSASINMSNEDLEALFSGETLPRGVPTVGGLDD